MSDSEEASKSGSIRAMLDSPKRIHRLANWYVFIFACGALALAGPLLIAAIYAAWRFWSERGRSLDAADSLERWSQFATYAGSLSQTVLGVATLFGALLVSLFITARLDRKRQADQLRKDAEADRERKSRELVRLSEKMVDTEFYVQVMYPAWEVALKWMDDDHPDIVRYRAEVVGAEFRLPKNYRARRENTDLAENSPRRHPHYKPYDQRHGPKKPVIRELSESLAFATWVRFWRNVKFLIDEDIVAKEDARSLFREWYMWWAPFMTEFAWVCVRLMERLDTEFGYKPHPGSWQQSSIQKIIELHVDLEISPHCGHRSCRALMRRVEAIANAVWEQMVEEIQADPNPDVDGSMDEAPARDMRILAIRRSRLTRKSPGKRRG